MLQNMTAVEILKLFAPLIVVEVGLAAYCTVDILRKGVRNLNKPIWIGIVIATNLIGAVCYFTLGKKRWQDD